MFFAIGFYLRIKTPPKASIIPDVNLIFFLAPGVDPSWVQDMPVRKITAPIVPRIRERTQKNLATTKIQNESLKIIDQSHWWLTSGNKV